MSNLILYRKVKAVTVEARMELWHKYVQLQVFNHLLARWMKVMLVPTIISATSTIIVCFYVTIRNNDVPGWIVFTFFYVGATIFGIVFWMSYQLILGILASEAVIGLLASMEGEHDSRD